jgi:hypothetical protein
MTMLVELTMIVSVANMFARQSIVRRARNKTIAPSETTAKIS